MKYKYSLNNNNQLLIKSRQLKKPVAARGNFSVDKKNLLIYWLNEPAHWHREQGLPNKIVFRGNWQLDKNHDLVLILDETKGQHKADRLILKGEIISMDKDIFAFEIKSYDSEGLLHLQIIKLTGFWQADKYNRLCFAVEKKAIPDILLLKGVWQLNQNQQIVYIYEKTNLRTKTKSQNTLTFTGFWQINEKNKLSYILTYGSASRFDFRVQLESPNLYPQEGVIKYRLGIGLKGISSRGAAGLSSNGKGPIKIISLYGAWKLHRKAVLSFSIDYGDSRAQAIKFETTVDLVKKNELTLSLLSRERKSVGISITFTRNFLKHPESQAFLRLKRLCSESALEVGLRTPF